MGKRKLLLLIVWLTTFVAVSQQTDNQQITFTPRWKGVKTIALADEVKVVRILADEALYEGNLRQNPYFLFSLPVGFIAENIATSYEYLPSSEANLLIASTFEGEKNFKILDQGENQALHVRGIMQENGRLKKLVSLTYRLVRAPERRTTNNLGLQFPNQSVLANGTWYKLAVPQKGMYRIDLALLNQMGIAATAIDPRKIKIYSNKGGMLHGSNSTNRLSDLIELPIMVTGESDGKFDSEDRVIFYAEGPHQWNLVNGKFQHDLNLYDDRHYVFLTVGPGNGLRISNKATVSAPTTLDITTFDDYQFWEKEERNFLKSGRKWYGEEFDIQLSRNYSFNFPNRNPASSVTLTAALVARSYGFSSTFTLDFGNGQPQSVVLPGLLSGPYANVGAEVTSSFNFNPSGDGFNLNLRYNKNATTSLGWLDYLEVQANRLLKPVGNQLLFRSIEALNHDLVRFKIEDAASGYNVWEVTHPWTISALATSLNGSQLSFTDSGKVLREYLLWKGTDFAKPEYVGKIQNQNLHGIAQADYVIVGPSAFLPAMNRLAEIHRKKNGLTVAVASAEAIYNEFSCGRQDLTAIRDFVRVLWKKQTTPASRPKNLLLMGRASYDFKDRIKNNTNFVPGYQSESSLAPLATYCSDAYLGFMDDSEGFYDNQAFEQIDIGIGRLPVTSLQMAEQMVDKTDRYLSGASQTDARNMVSMVADDGDGNLHLDQTESISTLIKLRNPALNLEKVYLDAYNLQSLPGGNRYPAVNAAINSRLSNGALLVNYIGHGGINGWADERVLTIPDINSWQNPYGMPLFVTATCEFSRFDEAERLSAGELVLLNPNGGAIGLLTTSRVTFSGDNFALSSHLFNNVMFQREADGSGLSFGEIFRRTVNVSLYSTNTRNFTLLGDPALKLPLPVNQSLALKLNNVNIGPAADTLKALSKVTISGEIRTSTGTLIQDFNGIIYPTVFDKKTNTRTLGNSRESLPIVFSDQTSILFKGRASVTNGLYSFSFIVPKDIAYNFGYGRISLYASETNGREANGFNDSIWVGGAATSFVTDNIGPQIRLHLNDNKFVSGGLVNDQPILLARLSDSSGINTVGNGIGHEITAIINQNTNQPINLNRFYQSKLDDFREGEIRYPLSKLDPGTYTLRLKAWDVYNNSSEEQIEFVVADGQQLQIKNLLNYPNPFTTQTQFHFDHNRPGVPLEATLRIHSVSGQLVKSMKKSIQSVGTHEDSFQWDGFDEFGDRLGRGVYFYTIRLQSYDGQSVQARQKLVLLK